MKCRYSSVRRKCNFFLKSLLRKWNSYKTLARLCLFNRDNIHCKESFAWPLLTLCEEISDSQEVKRGRVNNGNVAEIALYKYFFIFDGCLFETAMQNPYYDTPHRFVDSIDKNHIIGSGHLRKQRKSTQRTHSKRSGSILITNDNNNIVEGPLHICIPTLSPTV